MACKRLLEDLKAEQDKVDDAEGYSEWPEKIRRLQPTISSLHESLVLVQEKLDLQWTVDAGPLRKVVRSAIWPVIEKQIEKLNKSIEHDMQLLQFALTVDLQDLVQHIEKSQAQHTKYLKDIRDMLQTESTDRAAEVREELLDWLTPIKFGIRHSEFFNRRQPGTGVWLLNSPEFSFWRNTKGQTLLCPGMPGAGKTILTSVVIQNLMDEFDSVAFLYCDFRRKAEQGLNDLLANLVKQLLRSQAFLPPAVEQLRKRHSNRGTRPSTDELSQALESVVTAGSRSFVLVDALDECGDCRGRLLKILFDLQTRSDINLFATSRDLPEIVSQFEDHPKLEIRASEDDIRTYIDGYLTTKMSSFPGFWKKTQDLQVTVTNVIVTAADGMYVY
jgi:hypothetical protein